MISVFHIVLNANAHDLTVTNKSMKAGFRSAKIERSGFFAGFFAVSGAKKPVSGTFI